MSDSRCSDLKVIKTIRDAFAPAPRIYYMISESIFFVVLFKSLMQVKSSRKHLEIIRYRRIQTVLFSIDLCLIIGMIIYRILNIFKLVPTYDYYYYVDAFCTAFTVYNMTQFGLMLPRLFKVTQQNEHILTGSYLKKRLFPLFSIVTQHSSLTITQKLINSPNVPSIPSTPDRLLTRQRKYSLEDDNQLSKLNPVSLKVEYPSANHLTEINEEIVDSPVALVSSKESIK
ncbi:12676_t:CDS:1 [Ambispora gerdemannii]|uniref:12676_t:CDS:1 n=1 Tax=Ambispora gerdemannii TaxID=144530 RepID=A0A9N8W4J0_9GLOM|nr:12676_t:CDS:1 [Ambispora gerdemannii]